MMMGIWSGGSKGVLGVTKHWEKAKKKFIVQTNVDQIVKDPEGFLMLSVTVSIRN